jgi:hypothetical protein
MFFDISSVISLLKSDDADTKKDNKKESKKEDPNMIKSKKYEAKDYDENNCPDTNADTKDLKKKSTKKCEDSPTTDNMDNEPF